jgi:hypothetical protein
LIITGLAFFLSLPLSVNAAELYFTPSSQTVRQNDNFTVEVWLDTQEQDINAIEANLFFSQGKMELVDISRGGSLLELWLSEPSFSNETGEINFSGGVPKGFQGKGKLLSLTFRPVALGSDITTAQIIFQNGSKALLNNGYGSEAPLTLQKADFVIMAAPEGLPAISSKTHPNQLDWYANNKPNFSWVAAQGADYSYQLSGSDKKIIASGEKTSDGSAKTDSLDFDLSKEGDGVFYFSLSQKLPGQEWSEEAAHFRVMIDAVSPEEFLPQIGKDDYISEGKYFISFAAKDKTSGISRYEIAERDDLGIFNFIDDYFGKSVWKEAASPYLLARQELKTKILIKAVDKAGNEKIAKVIPPNSVVYWQIGITLLILIILVAIAAIIKKSKKAKSKD